MIMWTSTHTYPDFNLSHSTSSNFNNLMCVLYVAYRIFLVSNINMENIMEEEYNNKFDALASTIKIEDISSDELNQEILRRLKDNDPDLEYLCISGDDQLPDENDFYPDNGEALGWLGYYIGKSITVDTLYIKTVPSPSCNDGVEEFRREMGRNKSIRSICFGGNLLDGKIFYMLDSFFRNNNNLIGIEVRDWDMGVECVRQLSLALGSCSNNRSLKRIELSHNQIGHVQLVDIIAALIMHPQLEYLYLQDMNVGRNECTALATLSENTTKQLQILDLYGNNVDDDGIESLTHAISGSNLQVLTLSCNRAITARGWKKVSTLLEMSDFELEKLYLSANNIDDEVALIFATSLKGNSKLKTLDLTDCDGITEGGWAHFSSPLCDTSSINKTYLSNHTLEDLGSTHIPTDIQQYLILNSNSEDKGQIAMAKIIRHHSHFNMQPFFEWEFKVLPLMITWLEKAGAHTSNFGEEINRTKLSITYDFIREFPMLYIEPVTRKETEECSAMEIQLQEGDKCQQAELEEVQQRKERAMRRLL